MNQDEVDLIYDYLHENFRYENGELIRKKSTFGNPVGRNMGRLSCDKRKRNGDYRDPVMMAIFTINKKRYIKQLSFLIYLYHHKVWPKNLQNIDGNPLNIDIENLRLREKKDLYKSRIISIYPNRDNIGVTFCNDKNRYRASTGLGGERLLIGYFKDKNVAIEAVKNIRHLYFEKNLSTDEIKRITKEKYKNKLKSNTGIRNIYLVKNGYGFAFMNNGKLTRATGFKTTEEAHAAYLKAKEELK